MNHAAEKVPEPIVTLRNEHRYMRFLLETLLERLQGRGLEAPSDYYLIQDIARYLHEYSDVVHHPTEDQLFELLVMRDPGSKKNVERLQLDHKRLEAGTAKIMQLLEVASKKKTAEADEAAHRAIKRYVGQLQKHLQIEETILFPRTIECLANKDWKTIAARQNKVDDPLFGETVGHEYRALFEYFSSRTDSVSRRLTRSGFLQFDNLVISADALQQDFDEMCSLISRYAGSLMHESRSAKNVIVSNPSIASILSTPFRLARSLGGETIAFSKDAAGIYVKSVKHAAAPFFGGSSGDKQNQAH